MNEMQQHCQERIGATDRMRFYDKTKLAALNRAA